jgi:hypothetical protein
MYSLHERQSTPGGHFCTWTPLPNHLTHLRNLVMWSGKFHFRRVRQDLKQVLRTFSWPRTFKGTQSTISSRRQWVMSARVACQMQHSNCGRNTGNWTIADSFISVFPGGHSPASQRRNSGSIPNTHMRFVVYRMSLGQHFITRFRSILTQCSSERYSVKIWGQSINRRSTTIYIYTQNCISLRERAIQQSSQSSCLPSKYVKTVKATVYGTKLQLHHSIYTIRITWSFSLTGKTNGTWK